MPAATADVPSVALSFANNFWGKEDAGVGPLLGRMAGAKQTCDELKAFYGARASIEEEYARKLLSLCRKSLGSQESGTLRTSLDTVRGEVDAMAKQHQSIAVQMKTELEEPLSAFAGGMKERRKIVQATVEKLLKTKIQQTTQVNKVKSQHPGYRTAGGWTSVLTCNQTRDKYEQECLKIKGYLAQGHMVMGQEERRNKAKLEKTQISVVTSNTEYEAAVKALEDTTVRWNREWKAAADKFQDLEEERLDFTKSSLWTFANIASTVCVSDDSSCEKIRLSLEKMDMEKDIAIFISEKGTGQEIPDAPRYINFCRGDINDAQSEASVEEDNYSVAQFPRSINPAFRSSSPQPSTFESHHDPNSELANNLAHRDPHQSNSREATVTPQKQASAPPPQQQAMRMSVDENRRQGSHGAVQAYDAREHGPVAAVPHDPYPMDGMTMLCRPGNQAGTLSDRSSQVTSARPSSRDEHSDYSNPTSFSSIEPPSGQTSPLKQDSELSSASSPDKRVAKKKSGFFQNHSPFRRKSMKDLQGGGGGGGRNTWGPANGSDVGSSRQPQAYNTGSPTKMTHYPRTASPEPINANASLALGVGQNVLPVARPDDMRRGAAQVPPQSMDESDPIAMALAELKGVTLGKGSPVGKQGSVRMSADHYHGMATPAPGTDTRSIPAPGSQDRGSMSWGTPPPSYHQQAPVSRLGVPPPAVTSKAMKQASEKVASQTRNIFGSEGREGHAGYGSSSSRSGQRGYDRPRAASPAPARSASPQPPRGGDHRGSDYRSASPNPYNGRQNRNGSQSSFQQQPQPAGRGSSQGYYRGSSPGDAGRHQSPGAYGDYKGRQSQSSYDGGDMAVQLSPGADDGYGSQRSRHGRSESRAMGFYEGGASVSSGGSRARSKSVADPARQYTRDGRPILHYARALFMYQAAIPEELGFAKGDYLAVLRHQDDGWWEAEVHGGNGRVGLVPSNYLQQC